MEEQGIQELLEDELKLLDLSGAERLCDILRGLLACLKDLNDRVALLEAGSPAAPPETPVS